MNNSQWILINIEALETSLPITEGIFLLFISNQKVFDINAILSKITYFSLYFFFVMHVIYNSMKKEDPNDDNEGVV